jgi:1-acyl-sn-glycerol-3-phosphate acyltransferase
MRTNCELWRRFLYWFIGRVYFERITLINPELAPKIGPVLYLGLHRNGAVDGFVYHHTLGSPTFMISTQLRRNWLARLFFEGIAVARTKDEGDHGDNDEALRDCLEHLRAGGSLFVFPEGTSSLGPRHLPFKSGGIWLILEYLQQKGPPLQVIPVGIHYECPWAFRSKVEVVLGNPLKLELPGGLSSLAKLKELKRRSQNGLEEVGLNVISAEYQDRIQRLAYVATLATPCSYFRSLKVLENQIPAPILQEAAQLESRLSGRRLLFHQGIPLVPMGSVVIYMAALVVLGPVVAAAMLANAPPLLAGWFAGRKFPDDLNVISLWRILIGIPCFLLWLALWAVVCLCYGKLWFLAYAALTWAGLFLYYRVKKLLVAVYNGLRYPGLRPLMLKFREIVVDLLPAERSNA